MNDGKHSVRSSASSILLTLRSKSMMQRITPFTPPYLIFINIEDRTPRRAGAGEVQRVFTRYALHSGQPFVYPWGTSPNPA